MGKIHSILKLGEILPAIPDNLQLLYSVPSLGIDESKGPPSFVFVTHQLVLDEFPYKFPESAGFFITNCWLGAVGVYEQRIVVRQPDGEPLVDTTSRPFELEDSDIPYTAITFFQGLELPEPGLYRVTIYSQDNPVLRYPIHVLSEKDVLGAEEDS
ncbi:MAG TPA: hypothetical protein EYO33_25125 [Phycisphaerales bacterium]|nr:hypothetical protein [Phycisphaerales bacterium]